jgi:hypothetical protein
MRREILVEILVLVDSKRVGPFSSTTLRRRVQTINAIERFLVSVWCLKWESTSETKENHEYLRDEI